jgi:hypothetical protein
VKITVISPASSPGNQEYILGENGKELCFSTVQEAINYLADRNYTLNDLRRLNFNLGRGKAEEPEENSPVLRGKGLTPREAAKRMFISYSTFNNLKRKDCLPFKPHYSSARKMIVDSMDVDEHMAFIKTISGQNAWLQFLKEHTINNGGAEKK